MNQASSVRKALVVTKEEALRNFESKICQGEGYDVIQARWGAEAFDLYQQHAPIAMVITDLLYDWSDWRLAMRGDGQTIKNGIQLAVAIRKLYKHQAIVIQTYTATDHVSKHLTKDLAGVTMLHKPFRPEQLITLLRESDCRRAGQGRH